MNTQDFLEQLQNHPDKALVFQYPNLSKQQAEPIPAGYHITEVMQASINAMDCGGQAAHWHQTVVQLMGPNRLDQAKFMRVEKFLRIFGRVRAGLPVTPDPNAELRFEYGNSQQPAIHYHVERLEPQGHSLHVHLSAPGVTCKASDRQIAELACCGPVADTISDALWGASNPRKGQCCQ